VLKRECDVKIILHYKFQPSVTNISDIEDYRRCGYEMGNIIVTVPTKNVVSRR
jgi:hypothetical protein